MPTNFKYKFEQNGQPKGQCPQCGKRGVFRYYEGVDREFGKCERANNCGYHSKPDASIKPTELPQVIEKPQVYVDALKVDAWRNNISSPFHTWAKSLGVTDDHLKKWNIGSTEKGETVFIHKNQKGEWWNAKFIAYTEGGSRKKDMNAYYMKHLKDGKYHTSLFGEHLLGDVSRSVCIVESEKTAVIGSYFYPDYDFVACGANKGLTDDKVGVLVGRFVINLRDADVAGRSTCTAAKMQKNGCQTFCTRCIVPYIENRLLQWNITYRGVDLFPENTDGYDLADAIRDGLRPNLLEAVMKAAPIAETKVIEDDEDEEDYSTLQYRLPYGVDYKEVLEYGFFEHKHRYYLLRKDYDFENVSNFTMEVLFLIVGVNAKRIVKVTNIHGKSKVIDMAIGDLISVEKFKERVESLGNFQFQGKASDLARIKSKLFNLEKAAQEIATLGQHKEDFYTFANGIYLFKTNNFVEIDDKGMIELDVDSLDDNGKKIKQKEHFYIPVLGNIQADDNDDLRNYRKFLHRPTAITFQEWSKLFCDVYGDNGKVCLAFAIVSLFRDFIQESLRFTPMLFLFGQRGSGKGTMANSILNLWGISQDPLMLGGASTVVGFMRKLGQFYNAIVWLDEYKNEIDDKKIESLKNIWDGIGYERGVKDQSNRTQVSPVRSAAILSGQEMPNREPALFSRTILLRFATTARNQADIDKYVTLMGMEQQGITNCTLEILKHREYFKENFKEKYGEAFSLLKKAFADKDVIDRQLNNHAALIAAVWVIGKKINMPFSEIDLIKIAEINIDSQRIMMRTSNEVQVFFEMVVFLLESKEIKYGEALQIKDEYLLLRVKVILPYYRIHARQQGLKAMDKGTLEDYLEVSEAFDVLESKKSAHRFKNLTNPTTAKVFLLPKVKELYGIDFQELVSNMDVTD